MVSPVRRVVASQISLRNTMDFPKRITLEFTNHCNLHCVFCPRRFMEKETGFMDVGLARKLMEEMGHWSRTEPVAVVPFFRGESLTHPQWDILLEYLHEFGLGPIQMATNASLLTEARALRLLEIGVDTLSFSMDTLDPQVYRLLRGSDYKKSLANVLRFLEMRADHQGQGGCRVVQVSAVETEKNRDGMDAFVDFWRGLADRIRIYPEHSADGNPGSLPGKSPVTTPRIACRKVMEEMVIYWNGDVALCNHDWTRRVTGQFIGSVQEHDIHTVWHSAAYEAIRQAHFSNRLEGIAPCEHCAHWRGEPVGIVKE